MGLDLEKRVLDYRETWNLRADEKA